VLFGLVADLLLVVVLFALAVNFLSGEEWIEFVVEVLWHFFVQQGHVHDFFVQ
jgi:hypothetical protein